MLGIPRNGSFRNIPNLLATLEEKIPVQLYVGSVLPMRDISERIATFEETRVHVSSWNNLELAIFSRSEWTEHGLVIDKIVQEFLSITQGTEAFVATYHMDDARRETVNDKPNILFTKLAKQLDGDVVDAIHRGELDHIHVYANSPKVQAAFRLEILFRRAFPLHPIRTSSMQINICPIGLSSDHIESIRQWFMTLLENQMVELNPIHAYFTSNENEYLRSLLGLHIDQRQFFDGISEDRKLIPSLDTLTKGVFECMGLNERHVEILGTNWEKILTHCTYKKVGAAYPLYILHLENPKMTARGLLETIEFLRPIVKLS